MYWDIRVLSWIELLSAMELVIEPRATERLLVLGLGGEAFLGSVRRL